MRFLIPFFLFLSLSCIGQHTLGFSESTISPKASLEDVSWISGHWKGDAFGGVIEEIWSEPLGQSMMFSFRLVVEGVVNFYEIGHIKQEGETIELQLKHFNGDLKGWEDKDEVQCFKLVKLNDTTVYFDRITYSKRSDTEMQVFIRNEEKGQIATEIEFNFKLME